MLAFVLVCAVGTVVHRPLARVPENTIKWVVAVLLISFGTFWGGEGIGVEWSLGDLTIPVLAAVYAVAGLALTSMLARRTAALRMRTEGAAR